MVNRCNKITNTLGHSIPGAACAASTVTTRTKKLQNKNEDYK